jgi:hypothetical protein
MASGFSIDGKDLDSLCAPKKTSDETLSGLGFTQLNSRYAKLVTKYNWNKLTPNIDRYKQDGSTLSIAAAGYAPGAHKRFSLTSPGTYYLSRSGSSLLLTGATTSTLTFSEGAPYYVLCVGVGGGASGSGGSGSADGVGGQAGGGCMFYLQVPDSPNKATLVVGSGGGSDAGQNGEDVDYCNPGSASYVNYGGSQITMNGGGSRNNGATVSYPTANAIMGRILSVTGAKGTHGTGTSQSAQSHATGIGGSVGWSAYSGGASPGGGGGGGASIFANGGQGGNSSAGSPGSYGSGGGGGSNSWFNGKAGARGGNGRIDIYY